jgi:predicted O-methyltransferase YrrM
VTIKSSDLCYQHGRLLYSTVAQYVRDHRDEHLTIVETGTARGFSALCMAKALSDADACGTIVSFDVLPHDASILWNCVLDADGPRTREELLRDYADLVERYLIFQRGDTTRELARTYFPRVHLAFLDSSHTYEHVLAEFSSFRSRQKPGDVLFFDDYTEDVFPGVVRAATRICREFGYNGVVVEAGPRRKYLVATKL